MLFCSVFLGLIPLGFSGFIKPPIEGDQLPVETNIGKYNSHYNQWNHYKFCDAFYSFFQQGSYLI